MVDGRALARLLGDGEPDDPIAYAQRVLEDVRTGHATIAERHAVESTAAALGAGIAGLVNLHDPDVVTLAGLAPALRAAASESFEASLREGLTTFHRQSPPPLRDSLHSQGGSALGALSLAVDEITSPPALARWGARVALADQ